MRCRNVCRKLFPQSSVQVKRAKSGISSLPRKHICMQYLNRRRCKVHIVFMCDFQIILLVVDLRRSYRSYIWYVYMRIKTNLREISSRTIFNDILSDAADSRAGCKNVLYFSVSNQPFVFRSLSVSARNDISISVYCSPRCMRFLVLGTLPTLFIILPIPTFSAALLICQNKQIKKRFF